MKMTKKHLNKQTHITDGAAFLLPVSPGSLTEPGVSGSTDNENRDYLPHHSENDDFEMQLWELLALQVRRFTMGDSSSVPAETAKDLADGIRYCIDIYLKHFAEERSMPDILQEMNISELYEKGRKRVEQLTQYGKRLMKKARATALATGNIAYHDTLQALRGFFKAYNMEFMPQDIPCMIDYQLFVPVKNKEGIEYILSYLKRLIIENEFCLRFDPAKTALLMFAACADPIQDLVNIFQPLFNNALALTLLGKDALLLDVSEEDRCLLGKMLQTEDVNTLQSVIDLGCASLCETLSVNNPESKAYLALAAKELAVRLFPLKDYRHVFVSFGVSFGA